MAYCYSYNGKSRTGRLFGDDMNASQTSGLCTLAAIVAYPTLLWIVRKLDERRARKAVRRMRSLS
jgi:hypothetical protein